MANDLGRIQEDIIKILLAWHLPNQQAFVLSGELLTEIVEPALCAERERCAVIAEQHRDSQPAAVGARRAIAAAIRLGLEL